MRQAASRLSPLLAVMLAYGCTTIPSGPSVLVLPGTGKNFDQFRLDDALCRQYAYDQVAGVTPAQAATDSGAASAVLGTALGAAAGAAIGGGRGAAVGAGTGLLAGSLAGTGAAGVSAYATQQRYDNGYIQCMYAQGHRVPVSDQFVVGHGQTLYPPPPPPPPYSLSPPIR